MKKILLFIILATCGSVFAQKVAVIVNSPASIGGEKIYGGAAFGADLTSGQWTGDCVLADPNIGCTALTNKSAIAGKFCVIDRLTCSFDVKCLNAQDAGAIACVILNHNLSNAGGPPFRMANGNVGAQVTIPCVMLGYEDGLALKAAMKAGTVNMTIGAFDKEKVDLAITRTVCDGSFSQPRVIHPTYGAVPANQVRAAGDLSFVNGGFGTNVGTENQSTAKIQCVVKNGSTEIYNKSSASFQLDVDSTSGDLIDEMDYNGLAMGKYDFTYHVGTDVAEKFGVDNDYTSYFNVNSTVLSKCRFNFDSREPVRSGAYLFGGETAYRELMIPFRLKYGVGLQIDSVYGYLSTNTGTLANLYMEGRIYRWDDANADEVIQSEEMTLVALGTTTFPASDTRTAAPMSMSLENLDGSEAVYQVKKDNDLYFAAIQYPGGAHNIFFGYDNDYDASVLVNIKDANQALATEDLPYLTTTTQAVNGGPDMDAAGLFYFDCNGDRINEGETVYSPASIGVNISKGLVGTKDITDQSGNSIDLTPNPARDVLKAAIKLNNKSQINYQIFDVNGRLVYTASERNTSDQFNAEFNVNNLSNGQYILQVNTPKGFLKKSFQVNR
ncbi:MAG: PA domain-containing protein [Saprospiraceae bacterium]